MIDLKALKKIITTICLTAICFLPLRLEAAMMHQDNVLDYYPSNHLLFELDLSQYSEITLLTPGLSLMNEPQAYIESDDNAMNHVDINDFRLLFNKSAVYTDTCFHVQNEQLFETESMNNSVIRLKSTISPPFSLSVKVNFWFDCVLIVLLVLIFRKQRNKQQIVFSS